jgi:hypothetical protein
MHPWYFGVQVGLELKEIEVSPLTLKSIVDALLDSMASWAVQPLFIANQMKVNASLCRIEFDLLNPPWSNKAKCFGKEGFDIYAHIFACSWWLTTLRLQRA